MTDAAVTDTPMSDATVRRAVRLAHEIDEGHPVTGAHSRGVTALMLRMNEEEPQLAPPRTIALAGMLHDVGKLRIPKAILDLPRALDEGEFKLVRGHPELGVDVLAAYKIDDPVIVQMCRSHHEQWDGKGYPDKKSPDQVHPVARMGQVCDIMEALTASNRAYKEPMSPESCVEILNRDGGTRSDPEFTRRLASIPMEEIKTLLTVEGANRKIHEVLPELLPQAVVLDRMHARNAAEGPTAQDNAPAPPRARDQGRG